MKETGVHAKRMKAQAAIQSVPSKYPVSFGPVSHPSELKISVQHRNFLDLWVNPFGAKYLSVVNVN